MSIVFIGFMGAGKTTAARTAAAQLATEATDSDRLLEERFGSTIEDYFARAGEDAFRAQEESVVGDLLERSDAPAVVSLGGGALASERVRRALADHTVVLIDVDSDTAWRRAGGRQRPLARDRERFEALYSERRAVYDRSADVVLGDSTPQLIRAALPAITARPDRARMLWAEADSGAYPIYVGAGVIAQANASATAGRSFLISDETVAPLYANAIGDIAALLTFPAGERSKTWERAGELLRELARAGAAHDDRVLALGGGVVGDLAGFVASTYQRGIGCIGIPTTLVAQVDSAYGGKTGVDLPEGKNYAGAYHQPRAVYSDPSLLATLPPVELAAGWAELIKTALIAGGEFWQRARDPAASVDADFIFACARTKLAIVAADERDAGRRQVLNLGHTLGHAIETATGYSRYRHGEAVGLGLLAALSLSGLADLRGEVAALLAAHGLPVTIDPAVDRQAVLGAVQGDKKRRGGRVGWVLIARPGEWRVGCAVDRADVAGALEELYGR